MQAIYEAILLIPEEPSRATQILCKIQRTQPRFLEYLKTMAVQLYDRYAPRNQQQHGQYEIICKQMLSIFNRFVNVAFKEQGKEIFLNIENYYQWTLEILLCEKISLLNKKVLVSSFTQVIKGLCYQPQRIIELVELMMSRSMASASSIFVYVECLLQSSIPQTKVVESIKETYQFLYYVAISEYNSLVNFYKESYMEADVGQNAPNPKFLEKIKEGEYVLSQIHNVFKLFQSFFQKNTASQQFKALTNDLFFHPDIANYLSSILKIERDLFNNFEKPNMFDLKFIIMNNLRSSQKNAINIMKSHCLSILNIILRLSDTKFNLTCTDKLLMRQLFQLAEIIINELLICSHPDVFSVLEAQLQINNLISAMLGLLAIIITYKDLIHIFTSLNIQKLIRLTFFYSKTFEEEYRMYESNPDDYFYFSFYISDSPEQKQDNTQIGLIEQFSIRQKSVEFIRNMNQKVEGFHNIVIDICCDIIILENSLKRSNDLEARSLFMQKYGLDQSIFQCFNTDSALSVFAVLIQETWDKEEKHKKMYFFLTKIQLDNLSLLQLYRLYVCLAINHEIFIHIQGYALFCNIVNKVYKLDNRQCATTHAGYYFIEKLLRSRYNDNKDYDVFIEKVFDDLAQVLLNAKSSYPFQTIQDVLEVPNILEQHTCLSWINRTLDILNKRIINEINRGHDDTFRLILSLYLCLMKSAEKKIIEHRSLPYPNFSDECIEYNEQLISFINPGKFQYFERLLTQRQVQPQDEQVSVQFSAILLEMLVQQIPLSNQQCDFILHFTKYLLGYSGKYEQNIKKISFQMLYQLIHIKVFTFDEHTHNAILKWMKSNYYLSEISLNRICVILQQLYYYIDSNNNQNQANFLYFYSSIIEFLQKKFFEVLIQYHNYAEAIAEEIDINIRKINEINLRNEKIKTNPITVIRLYNTILLNPYFDITIIRKYHEMLRRYNYQIVPSYDLTMQVLSLQSLMKRSKNISVIECFRFTTELLGYNCKNPQLKCRKNTESDIQIANLVQGLRTSLIFIDPYQAYSLLVQQYVFSTQHSRYFESQKNDCVEINIMDYINNDAYMLNLVKKLTLVRNVNNKTRMIFKLKQSSPDQ